LGVALDPRRLYDPLGAGTMPRIICGGIILFCVISLGQSLLRARAQLSKSANSQPRDEGQAPDRPWLAVAFFVFLVALAIAIQLRVPYWISTSIFLFVSTMAVQRFKLSAVPLAAVISILVGIGVAYLFGDVFRVDLP
jgi:hypothetical protein